MGAVFGFSGQQNADWLERMSAALSHRGRFARQTAATSHSTLAYLADHRETERTVRGCGLVAAGDQAIAVSGRLLGPSAGQTPQTILEQYRQGGIESLSSFRGCYVIAIADRDAIYLMRDGAGARTVSYALCEGRLVFAVEPKAIHALPQFHCRLNTPALAQYLTFSFVPAAGTMLRGIFELAAGHWIRFLPKELEIDRGFRQRRWFFPELNSKSAPREVDSSGNGSQTVPRQFRRILADAVSERMPENETPVVFLSGGLDSSAIAAEVARQHGRPIRTYSLHFGRNYPNELEFARSVARRIGSEHEEIEIRPTRFVNRLRKMIWHLDDPIGDPITMPNYELASNVSATTRYGFNGEGGDPCFGGPKNIPMLLHHWYGGIERDDRFRERRYLASYRRAYEEIDRLLTPEVLAEIDATQHLEGVLTPFFETRTPSSFLDKLCAINIRLKGAHLILPKVERMMGAFGIEPLSPLFDDRMVEFSFRIDPTWKLRNGIEKFVLKQAFAEDLPDSVVNRPKSGMRVPVHYWFQSEMKRYARSIFNRRSIEAAGIFRYDRIKQLLDYNTEEGPGRYGLRLWMILTFEIWRRLVIEREPL